MGGRGDLILRVAGGEVRQRKPFVYQEAGGGRREIAARYALDEKQQVGFQLGEYDAARPLVIDPVLLYSTYLGGTESDTARAVSVSVDGSAYVTGFTRSFDFPLIAAVRTTLVDGRFGMDAFVTKLNSDGSAYLYSTYLGGGGFEQGNALALDALGNAYVVGQTSSEDFPVVNAFQDTKRGSDNVFITTFSASDVPFLRFGTTSYSAGEGGGSVSVEVVRGGDASAAVSVDYATVQGNFVQAQMVKAFLDSTEYRARFR